MATGYRQGRSDEQECTLGEETNADQQCKSGTGAASAGDPGTPERRANTALPTSIASVSLEMKLPNITIWGAKQTSANPNTRPPGVSNHPRMIRRRRMRRRFAIEITNEAKCRGGESGHHR